jgi:hypothetical protein
MQKKIKNVTYKLAAAVLATSLMLLFLEAAKFVLSGLKRPRFIIFTFEVSTKNASKTYPRKIRDYD